MGSSLSPSTPFLSINNHRYALRPCDISSFVSSSSPFLNFRISRHRRVALSAASFVENKFEVSWLPPERNTIDDYGGWAIVETQIEEKRKKKKKKGFLSFFLVGAGVSVAMLIGAIAYTSFTRKGFKLQCNTPLNALQRMLRQSDSIATRSGVIDTSVSNADLGVSEATPERLSDEKSEINASVSVEKLKRVVITVAADSTQQEALHLLKKLKISEDDVKAEELCTRREYARWLVKANSVLERNAQHRISMRLSGSVVPAFDDVNIEDPDFRFIQALAEAGIVLSKLSGKNYSSERDGPEVLGGIKFDPESFISRLDLVNWKAQLEYSCMPRIEEISTKEVGFMDVRTISPEASPELLMDMLAGDKSILRKVFGQSRRFQPQKPATKAQTAVALTSGRMTEAIRTELSRLKAENSAMLAEMEEIRSELLLRGDIQRYWEEKLNELKIYGLEVKKHFQAAIDDLEQEKVVRDISQNENTKERAALDCQRKLHVSLKDEVNEMSERLTYEKANFATEQKNLEDMLIDLLAKQDAMTEAKSILESEKEALRILRSWVEDEARRNQARAQVLEQVGRRWKWNDET